MLISDKKRFLFVHIQKTGGTSLTRHLKSQIPDLQLYFKAHTIYAYAETKYNIFYKAAFVRNPFDRLVSWYFAMDRSRKNPPNRLQTEAMKRANTFEEFIYNCGDVSFKEGWRPFSNNQFDYLLDREGNMSMDFIGRFESIGEDSKILCQHLGLKDIEIPHINSSSHKDYRYYYNDATRKIIAKKFEKDLDYFKYSF